MKTWGTAAAVALLALTGCSRSPDIDMTTIEDGIRDDLAEQVDVSPDSVDVECPSTIEWRVGEDFRCFAEDDTGRVKVTVHMENEAGEYTWETTGY